MKLSSRRLHESLPTSCCSYLPFYGAKLQLWDNNCTLTNQDIKRVKEYKQGQFRSQHIYRVDRENSLKEKTESLKVVCLR